VHFGRLVWLASRQVLPEHKAWLDETLRIVRRRGHYWIDIVGYASKLRPRASRDEAKSIQYNRDLSLKRASEVAFYLEFSDASVGPHIREFAARGNEDYAAAPTHDSPDERAVEIHLSLAVSPPVPPAQVEQSKPFPGGARCAQWAIAVPFGITATVVPGLVGAANVVVFRCCEGRGATHAYLTPGVGVGVSYSGPPLSKWKGIVQSLLGTMSYSGMSFANVTSIVPFNFNDLEGATCRLVQAGAGAGPGYVYAYLSVGGPTWYRTPHGELVKGYRDFVKNVGVGGKDLQIGAGGSGVGGPLLKLD
jgi:hypothetical protein